MGKDKIAETTYVSISASGIAEADPVNRQDISQDQQIIIKKLEELHLKKSAKSYQSARSELFSQNAGKYWSILGSASFDLGLNTEVVIMSIQN